MVFCMQNSDFKTKITTPYWSQTSPIVLCCKTATLASELQVSIGPSPHLWFLHEKQRLLDQNYKSPRVPEPTCRFCMQNSVISTRIPSLYGRQTSPTVFAYKTATLGPELQVSMGPRPHLRFFAYKTAPLAAELQVSMGPSPHLWFCACKTTWLASELLVSMGTIAHLWFLHTKQRLLDQNYKSLWITDFACWFVNAKEGG